MSDTPSYLDVNFDNVEEPKLMPTGEEVLLRILRAEPYVSQKSGRGGLLVTFGHATDPGYALVRTYFPNPLPNDDNDPAVAESNYQVLLKRKRLFSTFNIPTEARQLDLTDPTANELVGCTGRVILDIEQDPNGEYPDKNTIKRFIYDM